jgi:uncharacterized protein YjbJ (UPF0337 family)
MNKDRIEGVAKQASGNVKKATGKLDTRINVARLGVS